MLDTVYFKITNREENHYGFQYKDGLNILDGELDNSNLGCSREGLYFTDIKNIFKFLSFGVYLREVYLPTNDPKLRVILDKSRDKWRANMIILGPKYDLLDVDTFRYLISLGPDEDTYYQAMEC
jgi:hypothetical protein